MRAPLFAARSTANAVKCPPFLRPCRAKAAWRREVAGRRGAEKVKDRFDMAVGSHNAGSRLRLSPKYNASSNRSPA